MLYKFNPLNRNLLSVYKKWCFSLSEWLICVYSFCFVLGDFLKLKSIVVFAWIFVFLFDVFAIFLTVVFFTGLFRGFWILLVEKMSCCSENENFLSWSFPSLIGMKACYCDVPGIVTPLSIWAIKSSLNWLDSVSLPILVVSPNILQTTSPIFNV